MSLFSHFFKPKPEQPDADLILYAPVSGTLVPIHEVPDIVISEKVIGDGIAIAPDSDEILAPCSGTIVRLLKSRNAFSLRTEQGIEVYITFGLGTCELQGRGFSALKQIGDKVERGEPVLKVDLPSIQEEIKSALTSMIVVRSALTAGRLTAASGHCEAGVTPCVWLSLNSDTDLPAEKA